MRYQLTNGMTVVFERQSAAPVAAMQVWVKAGSADETRDEAGLAHLHEHMLFKGTARRGPGEIAREVEALGGEINAWTSFDQTVYHIVLASAHFAEGLDILADAVRRSTFDEQELAREIEVVVEEIKRSNDLPSRRVSRQMFESAYLAHPYRWPVLGTEESVRSFTRAKMLAFYEKHYTPDNIVLLVVGDVEEAQVRERVEALFGGDWGRSRRALPARAIEAAQHGLRISLAEDKVQEAQVALALHIPGIAAEDIPALDLLSVLLGQGEGSRLNLALKIEQALASDVYAYAYTPRDPGLLVLGGGLSREKLREAVAAMLTEIRRLQLHPLGEGDLAVGRAMVEADAVYGKETVQGLARKLGFYEAVAGSLEFEAAYYEKIAKLTVAEAFTVAQRYLDLNRLTFAGLFAEGAGLSRDDVAALVAEAATSSPPARPALPAPASSLAPPKKQVSLARRTISGIERATLASGATVLVKPERGVPLFALRAVFPGGLRYEDEKTNGVSQLAGRLLTRATKRRDGAAVAQAIDEMAGALAGSAGRNSLSLRGEFLARHFDRALRLFAECATEPAFCAEDLERERAGLLQDIRSRDDSPGGAVFELFTRTLYRVHPYRLDPLGEEASVKSLGAGELDWLRHGALHRSNLVLSIVGDVDVDRAFSLADELFGLPVGEKPVAPPIPAEPPQTEPRRSFKRLDKAQAHLVYGFLGTTIRGQDRYALDVLSSVLSGQGGRLFRELRDKRSLAYSVSAFSIEGIDPGYFGVYMGTSPDKVKQALEGIRAELDAVLQGPLPERELDRARRYLVGTHAIGLQKNSARAALIAYDDAYGVGADGYQRYEERIGAVTAERVLEVARRTIAPERGSLAILGSSAADVDF